VLDAHQEGFAIVAGAVEGGGKAFRPYRPGGGRNPAFGEPLVVPSVVGGVEPDWLDPVGGLPAAAPAADEPWVWDGRIVVRIG
jgi:hypothetical protein